jgi:hypothetical protein
VGLAAPPSGWGRVAGGLGNLFGAARPLQLQLRLVAGELLLLPLLLLPLRLLPRSSLRRTPAATR